MALLETTKIEEFTFYSGFTNGTPVHVEASAIGFQALFRFEDAAAARAFAQEILLHADVAEGKEGAREALAAAHAPPQQPDEQAVQPETIPVLGVEDAPADTDPF